MGTYLAIDAYYLFVAGVVDDTGEAIVRDRVATPSRNVWLLHGLIRRVVAARPGGTDVLQMVRGQL